MTHALDPGRRDFLRGAVALPAAVGALAGTAALLGGCAREPAVAEGYRFLRPQDLPMLRALLPAVIGDRALPADPAGRSAAVAQLVQSYDRLFMDTSPAIRAAFTPLLDLLTLGLTRGPLFGLWKSWEQADAGDAAAFLDRWAASRTGFLRGAYNGFNATATMAWYLDPAHGAAAGYPGPPRKVVIDDAA